jgi:hypothetical protein
MSTGFSSELHVVMEVNDSFLLAVLLSIVLFIIFRSLASLPPANLYKLSFQKRPEIP